MLNSFSVSRPLGNHKQLNDLGLPLSVPALEDIKIIGLILD